jgi:HicB family
MAERSTLTLRVPPELADRLRGAAHERGKSLNAYATTVLGAAVDPELAGSEIEQIRERLARAGLLATVHPAPRPDPERLAQARRAASKGRSLSDIVIDERG